MRLVLLSLLYLCCCDQVFADPDGGTQILDCDATVQNQHRLLIQQDQEHLTTIRAAMRNINENLQDLAQREQNLKDEAAKTSRLSTLLQVILSKIKQNGANACGISAEKQPIEIEIINLNSRLMEMDFTLNDLRSRKETSSLQLKQMQDQEKEIEISILHQEQQGTGGPLGSIETYLAAQLERSHETMDFERLVCQQRLEASSKLMDAKLEQVESVKNSSIRDLNIEIDIQKKKQKEKDDRIVNIEQQLQDAKTLHQICSVEEAENVNAIKTIEEKLKICEKQKTDASSENERDKYLIDAAKNGLVETMRSLVSTGANINARDGENFTPLIRAAWKNQSLAVKSLIEADANLDAQDINKHTALIWAAFNNQTEICKMLVDAGADVNLQNSYGNSALIYAAVKNNLEVVKMLLGKRAQVNAVNNAGEPPLLRAAVHANAELAKLLLENGAQVNIARDNGYTPLHIAAGHGHVEVAKVLVRFGANINVKANNGWTPLKNALYFKQFKVVNYLRLIGATE